jgi:hypothetical protein
MPGSSKWGFWGSKCFKTYLRPFLISKNLPGVILESPLKWGREGREERIGKGG